MKQTAFEVVIFDSDIVSEKILSKLSQCRVPCSHYSQMSSFQLYAKAFLLYRLRITTWHKLVAPHNENSIAHKIVHGIELPIKLTHFLVRINQKLHNQLLWPTSHHGWMQSPLVWNTLKEATTSKRYIVTFGNDLRPRRLPTATLS